MKVLLITLLTLSTIFASDSTATIWIEGSPVNINISKDIYINLNDFQNFINTQLQDFYFAETIVEDVTGDSLPDSITNEIFLVDEDCVVISKIISKGILVHSDSVLLAKEYGNDENICGSDSNYLKLFPYSLLYTGFKIKMEIYSFEQTTIDEKIFMPLAFKKDELERKGMNEDEITAELNDYKDYINNYKGKFINSLSLSNPDTYFYDSKLNKFVLFYAP